MRRKIIKILSIVLLFNFMFASGVYASGNQPSAFKKITYEAYPEAFSSAYLNGAQGLTKEQIEKNKAEIFEYLVSIGFNTATACGIMANIECESSFNPNAWGDNGTSYGICQWHSSRFEDMKQYCQQQGLDYTTVHGQLRYLKAELEGRLYNGVSIRKYLKENITNTPEGACEAGRYWCYYYEVPANRDEVSKKRGEKAQNEYWPVYGVKNMLTVTFMSDGAVFSAKTVEEGKTLKFDTLTKSGYDFLGWSTDPAVAIAEFSGGKTYIIRADVILYAVWQKIVPIICTVNFDPMGGEVETSDKLVTFNEKYGELPVPERENFNFVGWYTAADAGKRITEGSTVEIKTEHTLYARWTTGSVKGFVNNVTLPASITVKYKDSVGITPIIEKDEGVECQISFTSSDPDIVSVDVMGNLTAVKKGRAAVTCTVTDEYGGSVSAVTVVTVKYSLIQLLIKILLFGWIWY
ncbi:MAG: InlB B-repeat-containing protein [Clostridiales bacterium]|nr:InlB B-repeat-containing protein [Clostridiales bacterium]